MTRGPEGRWSVDSRARIGAGPMTLGNPDRPVGGLAVPRPAGRRAAAARPRRLRRRARPGARALRPARRRSGAASGAVRGARQRRRRHAVPGDRRRRACGVHRLPLPTAPEPRHLRGLGQRPVRARAIPRQGNRPRLCSPPRSPSGGCAGGHQVMLEVGTRANRGAGAVRVGRLREPGQVLRDRAGPRRGDRAGSRGSRSGPSSTTMPTSRPPRACLPSSAVPPRARSGCRPCAGPTRSTLPAPTPDRVLALLDGPPVGFISLEFRHPFFTTAPQAWIPDLVVTESARGRDIGAALLDAAFAEAIRRGAYAAALESGHQRQVAHRLYEAAGMSRRRQLLHACSLSDTGRFSALGTERALRAPGTADCAHVARGSSEVFMSIIAWIVVGAIAG